jgi:hypothetical protein
MNELNSYWRNELGSEFRKKALDYIGGYAESYGNLKENKEEKTYTAELDVNDLLSTIVPVNLACNANSRYVMFVSLIKVSGKLGKTKFKDVTRRNKEEIKLIDNQNNEIDTNKVCIDSMLYLLDYLDSTLKVEDKNEGV